jgi:hypothetical protein
VQLFKAINGLRGSAFLEPDWIIMHPGDWEDIRLLTDTAGQFFGGGPFQGPYGSGQNLQASGQVNGNQDSLWGKPVYVTAAVGATKGTAIIGTRSSAQVWRRGGMSVEASNSHSNFFQLNLVAIRAEERLGWRCTGTVRLDGTGPTCWYVEALPAQTDVTTSDRVVIAGRGTYDVTMVPTRTSELTRPVEVMQT